eukprot:Opistho-2@82256
MLAAARAAGSEGPSPSANLAASPVRSAAATAAFARARARAATRARPHPPRRSCVFGAFEKLLFPYPDAAPSPPPKGLLPFLWHSTHGLRPWLLAMTLLTAGIGAFEALLFSMLGRIVDWLAAVAPSRLWAEQGGTLMLLAAVLAGSTVLIALQSLIKQQALAGNFPMLLRWNFHHLMLGQSMGFYQDEFAGRVATKVMQTALAVRDTWMILAELLVFVVIYFVTPHVLCVD